MVELDQTQLCLYTRYVLALPSASVERSRTRRFVWNAALERPVYRRVTLACLCDRHPIRRAKCGGVTRTVGLTEVHTRDHIMRE